MQNPTMPRKLDHQTSAFMDRGVLQHLEDKSQRKKVSVLYSNVTDYYVAHNYFRFRNDRIHRVL